MERNVDEERKDCIGDLLDNTVEKAKIGEFRKVAEEKLSELNTAAGPEEEKYRAEMTGLVKTWSEQEEGICKIRKHLETCHPGWRECVESVVCGEVIRKVWDLKNKLIAKLGKPEIDLDLACEEFDAATSQLEAWKTISSWIKARLDLNQALIDEICTLDNCIDRLFVLYIFYFELQPAHNLLSAHAHSPAPELKDVDPERYYCQGSCTPPDQNDSGLCGYPWLINPDDYNCKLADVWKAWRDSGIAKAKAECAVEQVATCRTLYEEASDAAAKRAAAREALRRKDQRDCSDHTPQPPQGQSAHSVL